MVNHPIRSLCVSRDDFVDLFAVERRWKWGSFNDIEARSQCFRFGRDEARGATGAVIGADEELDFMAIGSGVRAKHPA